MKRSKLESNKEKSREVKRERQRLLSEKDDRRKRVEDEKDYRREERAFSIQFFVNKM